MTSAVRVFATIVGLVLGGCPALAHDFWIDPSAFQAAPGTVVELRLRVGEHFFGDALPRDHAMLEQFIAAAPDGVTPVPGRHGRDPAGVIRIVQPGLVVVGYQSRPSSTEMRPEVFDAYLAAEGLDRVTALRAARRQRSGSVREIFSRCAKALLLIGPNGGLGHDRILGFTLELVPERNPYSMRAGADLPVRLLYEGQPLEGALVVAMSRDDPAMTARARSDRGGRVSLRLSREGAWLIKAVHMIPAAPGSSAEWESLWASLTFELPQIAATRPVTKRPQ